LAQRCAQPIIDVPQVTYFHDSPYPDCRPWKAMRPLPDPAHLPSMHPDPSGRTIGGAARGADHPGAPGRTQPADRPTARQMEDGSMHRQGALELRYGKTGWQLPPLSGTGRQAGPGVDGRQTDDPTGVRAGADRQPAVYRPHPMPSKPRPPCRAIRTPEAADPPGQQGGVLARY
jgi:hypothetical protein